MCESAEWTQQARAEAAFAAEVKSDAEDVAACEAAAAVAMRAEAQARAAEAEAKAAAKAAAEVAAEEAVRVAREEEEATAERLRAVRPTEGVGVRVAVSQPGVDTFSLGS